MLKQGNYTSIYLDFANSSVHYFSIINKHVVHESRGLIEKPFTSEYYVKLAEALKDLTSKSTPAQAANTTIVFPDSVIFQNAVSFPALKSKDISKPLEIYLNNTYKNLADLNIKKEKLIVTKQNQTVLLTGIIQDVIGNIKVACNNAKFIPGNFTFASNATVCAINDINEKLHGQTYLFMDVKENSTKYILVFKGKVIGSFDLKMGLSSLNAKELAAEDVLLYAPHAELLVINAREKARQKALTLAGDNNEENKEEGEIDIDSATPEDEENAFAGFDSMSVSRKVEETNVVKTLPKKQARKLPKFMTREMPEDDEGRIYESFRIFIRWALDVINNSDNNIAFAKPNQVYVNIPKEYNYLFDKANLEQEENGVKFMPAALYKEKEEIVNNLEMYGGLLAKNSKKSIMF